MPFFIQLQAPDTHRTRPGQVKRRTINQLPGPYPHPPGHGQPHVMYLLPRCLTVLPCHPLLLRNPMYHNNFLDRRNLIAFLRLLKQYPARCTDQTKPKKKKPSGRYCEAAQFQREVPARKPGTGILQPRQGTYLPYLGVLGKKKKTDVRQAVPVQYLYIYGVGSQSHANTIFLATPVSTSRLFPTFHHLSILSPSFPPYLSSHLFPSCEEKRHKDSRTGQFRPRLFQLQILLWFFAAAACCARQLS